MSESVQVVKSVPSALTPSNRDNQISLKDDPHRETGITEWAAVYLSGPLDDSQGFSGLPGHQSPISFQWGDGGHRIACKPWASLKVIWG